MNQLTGAEERVTISWNELERSVVDNVTKQTNYEELLTADVLSAVRPYAEKLAKRTCGAMDADDLIQSAMETLCSGGYVVAVQSMEGLLTRRIRLIYYRWVNGTNNTPGGPPKPFSAPQDRYMATGSLPAHDGIKQLTLPNPMESWETPLDVERALRTLNAKEQMFIRLRYWKELEMEEIATQMGVTVRTLERWHLLILPKLKAYLSAYESAAPSGKRTNGSFSA